MAFVVLVSTMSFTIDMHYCGDTLMDTAVFHKVETCGMEMQPAVSNSGCPVVKNDCCKDEQVLVKGQDELKISFDTVTFDQHVFIASFFYAYINLFEGTQDKVSSFGDYYSPLVIRQIYKLDETYLI
ncbi:hypothetical protein [Mariniflexile sp. AS56]|nr:hypothetical protein [Mariniflexile sp. AS56]MDO7171123.1 hypothetical protein [Mariniflexile sp. AS56]